MDDRIDVDAGEWRKQRNLVRCAKVYLIALPIILVSSLGFGCMLGTEKVVYKEKAIASFDPDRLIRAKHLIGEVYSLYALAHGCKETLPAWLSYEQSQEMDNLESKLQELPLDIRVEAHKQLGY